MKPFGQLTAAVVLTASALTASGVILAADGSDMPKELTRQQITQEVTTSHPGAMVEHAVRIRKGDHDYWAVTLKDKAGKMEHLRLDAHTGKPVG